MNRSFIFAKPALNASAFLFLCLCILVSTSTLYAVEKERMNVLFIAVDDLRTEASVFGNKYIHSPNLERIAKMGVTFNRAYCQQAVCSPSRSSLLTGTRPDTTKVWDLETHFRKALPNVVTLPQLFKNNGYFVQGMGKLFHGSLDDPQSWSVPWTNPRKEIEVYALPASRPGANAKGVKANKKAKGAAFESADVPDNKFHDGALAEMAVKALQSSAAKKEPFWLGVGFIKPHLPFVAPKKYWDLYDPAKIDLAPNPFKPKGAPDYAFSSGGELHAYSGIPDGAIPDELARKLKHGYYASISYMDAQLGKVLDELDRLKLTDKTIIILWGDHGWKLGEHGAWCKHSNVENDTNAPLLIAVPGMRTAGKSTNSLVEFVDIYPTLAELCGLQLPKHLEGTSLVPVLKDPTVSVKNASFSQYPRGAKVMGYSMRTEQYRFTRWVNRDNPSKLEAVELYDHKNDPQENTNIANDPKNADLLAKLTQQWKKGWKGNGVVSSQVK